MTDLTPQTEEQGSVATAPAPAALEVTGLVAGYDRATVLREVSLTIPQGSVTALVGPNGAGKTTLLRAVSGLIRPTAGEVRLDGQDITGLPPFKRAKLGLCHISEGRAVFKRLTVRENLIMQAEPGFEKQAMERATEVFPVLGKRMLQTVGTMSGGEQQMLAMARAYVREPRIVLVDEPSLGLAPRMVDVIFEFLSNGLVKQRGTSVVIVDQFVGRVLDIAQDAYVMRRGTIAFSGTAKQLQSSDLFAHYMSEGSIG
jgi:branched-chain amino acid transport system ATP-binding protein